MDLSLILAIVITCIIILFCTLYFINETFKFYCKSMLYGLIIIGVSLTWPIFILNPRKPSNQKYVYWLYFNVCRIFGIKYNVKYGDNLKKYDSFVIVSNHQSSLDLLTQATVWPDNCTTIAKKEVIYLGPFGALSYMTGVVYIDRSDIESSRKTLSQLATTLKSKELKVWIYPEGTRNHGTGLLPFKKGAFHLAIEAQVPICPVVISSYYTFYCRYERRFKPGNVTVTCLPPIETQGLTSEDVDALTKKVRDQMFETFLSTSDLSPEIRARASENEKVFEIKRLQHLAYKKDHHPDNPDGQLKSPIERTAGSSGGNQEGRPTERKDQDRNSYRKPAEYWQTDPGITDVIINFFRRRPKPQPNHPPPHSRKHNGLIDEGFAL